MGYAIDARLEALEVGELADYPTQLLIDEMKSSYNAIFDEVISIYFVFASPNRLVFRHRHSKRGDAQTERTVR